MQKCSAVKERIQIWRVMRWVLHALVPVVLNHTRRNVSGWFEKNFHFLENCEYIPGWVVFLIAADPFLFRARPMENHKTWASFGSAEPSIVSTWTAILPTYLKGCWLIRSLDVRAGQLPLCVSLHRFNNVDLRWTPTKKGSHSIVVYFWASIYFLTEPVFWIAHVETIRPHEIRRTHEGGSCQIPQQPNWFHNITAR